jgi:outer membrane protein assembly factor BamB
MALGGCNSKLVHPDLKTDPDVFVRQWTLSSKSEWAAGERGSDRGSAAIFENTLVYSNEAQGVVSLYPGALAQRWVLKVPKGATTGLLVNGDRGFFAGGDGNVYAFKMATGEVLWKYPLRSTGPSLPYFAGGKLFLTTSDDIVYALDAGSGQWLWSYRRKNAGQPSISGAASPRMVGSDLVVGLSDGYLVAMNPEDGSLRWEKKLQEGG